MGPLQHVWTSKRVGTKTVSISTSYLFLHNKNKSELQMEN